jgi:hypothetical protein
MVAPEATRSIPTGGGARVRRQRRLGSCAHGPERGMLEHHRPGRTNDPRVPRTRYARTLGLASVAGAVDQGSSDSRLELGGILLHTRG